MQAVKAGPWDRIARDDATSCWIWTGATNYGKNGQAYGVVFKARPDGRRRKLYAHRVAYARAHGLSYNQLAGTDIHHTCGETLCVNPAHLEPLPADLHGALSRGAQTEYAGWRGYLESIGELEPAGT